MDLQGLWQNLASEFIAWLLLPSAGGSAVVVALLRYKNPRLAAVVLYGLASGALVAVIWFAFIAIVILSKQQPQTTLENVETNIKTWIDTLSLTSKKELDRESHFSYNVTLPNNITVSVNRTKMWDRYITFATRWVVPSVYQLMLEKLSTEQARG
jgi:hypothetical protein